MNDERRMTNDEVSPLSFVFGLSSEGEE